MRYAGAMKQAVLFGRALGLLGVLGGVGFVTLSEGEAHACGGCFHGESNTVVTDHRMVVSIAKDQTTLWDQIRYQGSPTSFAWVLPVHGTVQVGISSDVLFGTLDAFTSTQVIAPQQSCPVLRCCWGFPDAGTSFDAGGGVVVTKQEVVGPYQTVQLSASDPNALATWLAQNGYTIPPDVQPIVDQYVAEKFDFLAVKLVPGATVRAIRPIRVTTPGAGIALPLRMVAAGVGSTVGISLWVVGEGRYEPTNFPSFRIMDTDLTWDFTAARSNYAVVRAQKTAASNGTAWEIETSLGSLKTTVTSTVERSGFTFGSVTDATQDYDAAGPLTAAQVRAADLEALFHGMNEPDIKITRMRGDLARAALGKDLALGASVDQSIIVRTRFPASTKNPVPCATECPSWAKCEDGGNPSGSDGGGSNGGTVPSAGGGCSVAEGSGGSGGAWAGAAIGSLVLASSLRRLRRRRR